MTYSLTFMLRKYLQAKLEEASFHVWANDKSVWPYVDSSFIAR